MNRSRERVGDAMNDFERRRRHISGMLALLWTRFPRATLILSSIVGMAGRRRECKRCCGVCGYKVINSVARQVGGCVRRRDRHTDRSTVVKIGDDTFSDNCKYNNFIRMLVNLFFRAPHL